MKNFGKIFGISLFCLSPFFYTQTNAADIPVARSGIDLNKSTIKIVFEPDNSADNASSFICFGETVATLANPIEKNLAEIGVFDGSNPKDINRSATPFDVIANIHNNDDGTSTPLQDCFKAAGRYKTEVILSDAVGNKSDTNPTTSAIDPYTFDFIIKPGDVTNIKSELTEGNGGSNCTDPKANGLDTCIIYTSLHDYADNRVYQISNTGANRNISADNTESGGFPSFRSGLLLGGNPTSSGNLLPSGEVSGTYFSSTGADRIQLQSVMPTVDSDGFETIKKNVSFAYSNLPTIDNTGNLVTTATNSTSFSTNASIKFVKPVLVDIKAQPGTLSAAPADGSDDFQLASSFASLPNGESANFKDGSQRLKITVSPNIISNITSSPSLSMNLAATDEVIYSRQINSSNTKTIGKPGETNNIPDVNFSGNTSSVTVDAPDAETDNPSYNFSNIVDQVAPNNPLSKAIEYITNFFPANGAEGLTPSFDLKSLVEYDVTVNNSIGNPTSKNVSYYAGSTSNNANDNALGVFIESNVITRDSDTKILANDLAVLTGLAQKDVRETITRNAFALARNSSNRKTGRFSLTTELDDHEVLIVQKKPSETNSPTVQIGGQLPSGKKTLVIIDGNLLIDNNTYYGDEENDSFGVILINTNPEKMPETGNLFVKNNVNNIRGTFFADGGILPVENAVTVSNVQLGNVDNALDHKNQLRIVGSVLTRNTIGGAGKAGSETELQTPWGDTTSIDEAKRYDLLYTRDAIASPANCTHATNYNNPSPAAMTVPCSDGNTDYEKAYSFILRFDRKVLEQSPPGFTTTQSVQQ